MNATHVWHRHKKREFKLERDEAVARCTYTRVLKEDGLTDEARRLRARWLERRDALDSYRQHWLTFGQQTCCL